MTTSMMESASFHLKADDRLLMNGNREAALDQVNLAEIQLALLNMGSQEASTNQTQAVEFITGGSLSSLKMAQTVLLTIEQWFVVCNNKISDTINKNGCMLMIMLMIMYTY